MRGEHGCEVADGVARCLDADLLAEGVEEVAIGAAPEEVGSAPALDEVGVAHTKVRIMAAAVTVTPDDVVAGVAVELVGPPLADDHISAIAAMNRV